MWGSTDFRAQRLLYLDKAREETLAFFSFGPKAPPCGVMKVDCGRHFLRFAVRGIRGDGQGQAVLPEKPRRHIFVSLQAFLGSER